MPRGGGEPSSPGEYLSGDNLSNFGSEQEVVSARRRRRMSAPTALDTSAPLTGASNRANRGMVTTGKNRTGTATASSGGGSGGGSKPKHQLQHNGCGTGAAGGGSSEDPDRPPWNISTRLSAMAASGAGATGTKGSTEQQQHQSQQLFFAVAGPVATATGAGAAVAPIAEDVGRLLQSNTNRRKVKRSSIGSTTSNASGWDGGAGVANGSAGVRNRAHDDSAIGGGRGRDGRGGRGEAEDDGLLESAAPSQEDIRAMIARIRLQTAAEAETPAAAGSGSGGGGSRKIDSDGDHGTGGEKMVTNRARSVSTARSTANGTSGGSATDMVEIEEEERRLKEQASKLQLEMSALKRRRLEVRLVKVEQQLKEEAASRLIQREGRVRAALDRACEALRKEREERVNEVAAIKEDLRNKLEQLSDMYEEVSTRLESLEEAYDNAEVELKERADADQQKAVEREDRGVRRRIKAILTDYGPERSAERLAARQEEQRAANGDAASNSAATGGTERVPATAATGSANVAAGKLSGAPTSVPSLNYRGRSTSQQPLRHAEIHPERSEDHYSAKPNGKSERGDRRSSLGPARSVGALRRKRRTSVDGVAPR